MTIACEALLSIGLSWQEYWDGLPFPPPGDLSDPGIETVSPVDSALAEEFFTTSTTSKAHGLRYINQNSVLKSYPKGDGVWRWSLLEVSGFGIGYEGGTL